MGRKKGTYKIRKVLLAYMLGMFLIFSFMPQVVQAEEEYSESIEAAQIQEEVSEDEESIPVTSEEVSEDEESIPVTSEEVSEDEESIPVTSEEVSEDEESTPVTSEETSEDEESKLMTSEEVSEDEESTQITSEEPSTEREELIKAEELDLGDYLTEMSVGDKQLLIVTVLPMDVSESELRYHSSNTEVATVNGMGRITALKKGKTKITVTCEGVSESFELTVKEAQNTEIKVKELDLGDCPREIVIGTVNSSGEVKGIAPGEVTISISAGKITKEAKITVKIATKGISINRDYLVMKPNDTFQIMAQVQPADAPGEITYKSMNAKVAEVSENGMITAKTCGNTVIAVSNGDLQVSVNVIVNEEQMQ